MEPTLMRPRHEAIDHDDLQSSRPAQRCRYSHGEVRQWETRIWPALVLI